MALTDAIAVLFHKKGNLNRDRRVDGPVYLFFGPYVTAGGTGNKAEWVMPAAGEIVEVLYGAESDTADAAFNVENDGNDIWAADKADWGAGAFNAVPTQYKTFVRGGKLRVDVSAAGTAIVNGAITVVCVLYNANKK